MLEPRSGGEQVGHARIAAALGNGMAETPLLVAHSPATASTYPLTRETRKQAWACARPPG